MSISQNIKLTAILVEDIKIGGFTAYFAQFPNIISDGETKEEAMLNLMNLTKSVFEHLENEANAQNDHDKLGNHITTQSVELVPA